MKKKTHWHNLWNCKPQLTISLCSTCLLFIELDLHHDPYRKKVGFQKSPMKIATISTGGTPSHGPRKVWSAPESLTSEVQSLLLAFKAPWWPGLSLVIADVFFNVCLKEATLVCFFFGGGVFRVFFGRRNVRGVQMWLHMFYVILSKNLAGMCYRLRCVHSFLYNKLWWSHQIAAS